MTSNRLTQKIHNCWFCGSMRTYADAHCTGFKGLTASYIAQVRCRACCARGPKVKFEATVESGWSDLDKGDDNSAITAACEQAIREWNRGPQMPV